MNLADIQRRRIGICLGAALCLVLAEIAAWPFLLLWCWPHSVDFGDQTLTFFIAEVLACLWVLALGGVIGSYLNVVIYRCPRGKSLLGGSRCPRCEVAIKTRDNLPVLGWLMLKGRCRTCRLPISARYPLVELVIALLFLGLTQIELFGGGINLPGLLRSNLKGAMWNLFYPNWRLIGILAFHLWLLVSLFCWTMIRYDRELENNASLRVPWRFFVYTAVIGVIVPILFGWVYPLNWQNEFSATRYELLPRFLPKASEEVRAFKGPGLASVTTIVGGFAGAVAAVVSGLATFAPLGRFKELSQTILVLLAGFIAVGLFLGWQATVVALGLQIGLTWVLELASRFRGGLHARAMFALCTATLLAIVTFRGWAALLN